VAVAIVELDARNPRLAAMLGVDPAADISALLAGTPVESVATPFDSGGGWLFPAPPGADLAMREEICSRTREILDEVGRIGEWTVVDVPAVAEAPADVVAALDATDHAIVVVHLGVTRPEELAALRDLFGQRGRTPDGYLVVSDDPARSRWSLSVS
jgi:Mrp family chromosome partitioning ATPase